MSVIRRSEDGSDVYIYEDLGGRLVCACGWRCTVDIDKFLAHLNWHRERGDIVPARVDEEILNRRTSHD